MILIGNQRGNGRDLALHLMNARDNEHVTLHDIRGFVGNDLLDAFKEAEAISLGTKCNQYLFSLSLNPPPNADVAIEDFEAAITDIEKQLGLAGQPRAIVFHEKNARRHAHCVWSRIDTDKMRAINLPHYKIKLQSIARDLYRSHEWDMPQGFEDKSARDPNTFDQVEAAQAKLAKRDPKALKTLFRSLWEQSDSLRAFRAALLSEGFVLAQGSRRAFVAVDDSGKTYSLSRWTGAGAKALREQLGSAEGLPTIEESRQQFPAPVTEQTPPKTNRALDELVARHREERILLTKQQESQRQEHRRHRKDQLPSGLKAVWSKLTGQYDQICARLAAEEKVERLALRTAEDKLIGQQLEERRALQSQVDHKRALDDLMQSPDGGGADPRQYLILPKDAPLPTTAEVEQRAEVVLDHLSDKSESFTSAEIRALLTKISDDPIWCGRVHKALLKSSALVRLSDDQSERFTTADYKATHEQLMRNCQLLSADHSFAVTRKHLDLSP